MTRRHGCAAVKHLYDNLIFIQIWLIRSHYFLTCSHITETKSKTTTTKHTNKQKQTKTYDWNLKPTRIVCDFVVCSIFSSPKVAQLAFKANTNQIEGTHKTTITHNTKSLLWMLLSERSIRTTQHWSVYGTYSKHSLSCDEGVCLTYPLPGIIKRTTAPQRHFLFAELRET